MYLYGIKILKMPKNIEVYYISQKNNFIISDNEILDLDDIIYFVYDYENLISGDTKYTIEMVGVDVESEYEENNKYPEYLENYGSDIEETYYTWTAILFTQNEQILSNFWNNTFFYVLFKIFKYIEKIL